MTVSDMRCDVCGIPVSGPASGPGEARAGVRFSYHPGDPGMRDDSGVLCGACWHRWAETLGVPQNRTCARCGAPVRRRASLFLRRMDEPRAWQLCAPHAADLLNTLRTVDPKLDPETFRLPLDNARDEEVCDG